MMAEKKTAVSSMGLFLDGLGEIADKEFTQKEMNELAGRNNDQNVEDIIKMAVKLKERIQWS